MSGTNGAIRSWTVVALDRDQPCSNSYSRSPGTSGPFSTDGATFAKQALACSCSPQAYDSDPRPESVGLSRQRDRRSTGRAS